MGMRELLLAAAIVGMQAAKAWVPPPCAPVYSAGPFAGGDNVPTPLSTLLRFDYCFHVWPLSLRT